MKKIIPILVIVVLFMNFASAQETKVKEGKFGLRFENWTKKEQFSFCPDPYCKGVIVHKVYKDHPAEAAGVLVGDILTHINGVEIIDKKHCLEVMNNFDVNSGESKFKIIRNGVKIYLIVKFN